MKAKPDYLAHEAMDRASVVMRIIDEHLLSHRHIAADKALQRKVRAALKNVYDVYQAIGAKHLGGVK